MDILIILVIKYVEYNLNQLKEERSRSLSHRNSRQDSQSSIPSLIIESTSGDIFYTPVEQTDIAAVQSPLGLETQVNREPHSFDVQNFIRKASIGRDSESLRNSETSPLLRSSSLRTIKKGRMATLVGIMYAALGGMVASITLILTKSGVEVLLKSMFDNSNQFHGVFAFVLLSVLVLSAIVQVKLQLIRFTR